MLVKLPPKIDFNIIVIWHRCKKKERKKERERLRETNNNFKSDQVTLTLTNTHKKIYNEILNI